MMARALEAAQSDNGGPKFGLADLERFCDLTGNVDPIKYLAKKYLVTKEDEEKEAVRRVMAALPDLEKCIAVLKEKGKK